MVIIQEYGGYHTGIYWLSYRNIVVIIGGTWWLSYGAYSGYHTRDIVCLPYKEYGGYHKANIKWLS